MWGKPAYARKTGLAKSTAVRHPEVPNFKVTTLPSCGATCPQWPHSPLYPSDSFCFLSSLSQSPTPPHQADSFPFLISQHRGQMLDDLPLAGLRLSVIPDSIWWEEGLLKWSGCCCSSMSKSLLFGELWSLDPICCSSGLCTSHCGFSWRGFHKFRAVLGIRELKLFLPMCS